MDDNGPRTTETTGHAEPPGHQGPILVPIDFSSESRVALRWAAAYAKSSGVPLLILHVVHDPADAPGLYSDGQLADTGDGTLLDIDQAAERMLTKALTRFRRRNPGLAEDAEVRLIRGVPSTRIVEIADEVDARMIAMGSRGRTGLARILLGSTAERVVSTAGVPVIVLKDERKKRKKKDKKAKDKAKAKSDAKAEKSKKRKKDKQGKPAKGSKSK